MKNKNALSATAEERAPLRRDARQEVITGVVLIAIGIAFAFVVRSNYRAPGADAVMYRMVALLFSVLSIIPFVGGIICVSTFLVDAAKGRLRPTVKGVQECPDRYYRYLVTTWDALLDQIGAEEFSHILAKLATSKSIKMQDLAIRIHATIEKREQDAERIQRETDERKATLANLANHQNG